jgi:hypothetical protein
MALRDSPDLSFEIHPDLLPALRADLLEGRRARLASADRDVHATQHTPSVDPGVDDGGNPHLRPADPEMTPSFWR